MLRFIHQFHGRFGSGCASACFPRSVVLTRTLSAFVNDGKAIRDWGEADIPLGAHWVPSFDPALDFDDTTALGCQCPFESIPRHARSFGGIFGANMPTCKKTVAVLANVDPIKGKKQEGPGPRRPERSPGCEFFANLFIFAALVRHFSIKCIFLDAKRM